MCIQRKKQPTTCGVLVHDVTKDKQFESCLVMDMTYEGLNYDTFSLRTLEQGVKEMTRLSYHKQVLVMNHLKEYLSNEREDEEAMNQCIADSMRSYEKRARKSVAPSFNKPAAADGIASSQQQNPMINVTGDASTVSNTDNPANKNALEAAAVENPKQQNPNSEGMLGDTTSPCVDGSDDSQGDEGRNTSHDDEFGDTSDSDFLSESESSKRTKLNMRPKDSQAQHGRGARVHNQSTSRMAPSGEGISKGSVVDATALRELTRENNGLKKMIIGIPQGAGTGSQNRQSSKRIKVPTPTLPAGEESLKIRAS